jgi:hypothetical protein
VLGLRVRLRVLEVALDAQLDACFSDAAALGKTTTA